MGICPIRIIPPTANGVGRGGSSDCLPTHSLINTLHDRFNTRSCPIQAPQAFLLDVRECAEESTELDEFYAKFDERRDQRVRELESAWEETSCLMESVLLFEPICGYHGCKSRSMDSSNGHGKKRHENRSVSRVLRSGTAHVLRSLDMFL
ncbi:hypothetical protein L209DRAFT_754750 [Thermothelomyces heterothallicus CBS 203.75]